MCEIPIVRRYDLKPCERRGDSVLLVYPVPLQSLKRLFQTILLGHRRQTFPHELHLIFLLYLKFFQPILHHFLRYFGVLELI